MITTVGLLTVAWHLARPTSGLSGAVGEIVLDLGPTGQATSPVAASLARALADPDLLIRTFQPDTGWTDDRGRPVADPEAERGERGVTAAATAAGRRVMLVHGPKGAGDTELARAAARAAALALESVRVEALVRRQALDIRLSAARLVTVDDTQRGVLAERLRAGPIARLARIRGPQRDRAADPFVAEIDRIVDDLHRMAQGLDPAALADGRTVREALYDLARRADVPVDCDLDEKLDRLPDDSSALVYYATSECLTNIARHAHATAAHLQVRLDRTLVVDIHDNGHGGAVANPGGGLQGLARPDRDRRWDVADPQSGRGPDRDPCRGAAPSSTDLGAPVRPPGWRGRRVRQRVTRRRRPALPAAVRKSRSVG